MEWKRTFFLKRAFFASVLMVSSLGITRSVLADNQLHLTAQSSTLLTARSISYDEKQDIITAEGDVIVSQGDRVLHADKITYNRKTNFVLAEGNVYLEEAAGEVIFLGTAEITGDLKTGFAQEARMILADDSKLAAATAVRSNGTRNEFEKVVYSPCDLCKNDPNRPPLWQIKARHVLWDQQKQTVEYTDATMEMLGVPVAYTPYLSHPDPTVKKKSGFLAPSFGGGSDMGAAIIAPYYFNIAPHKDFTFTPFLGTKTQIAMGRYRQRFSKGILDFAASSAHVSSKRTKQEASSHWHVNGKGRYDATEHWRLGADVVRSSDRNYVKRYSRLGVSSQSVLTSKVFAEGFYDASYLNIQGISFQGLRPEDQKKTIPTIAPLIDVNYKSPPLWQRSWMTVDLNTLSLSRQVGANSRRVSVTGGWHLPYYSSWGDITQLDLTLRMDQYHVESFVPTGASRAVNTFQGRVFPQAALHWSYPFINQFKTTQFLLTPKASLIGSPNLGLNKKIPNEDSRIFELSDTNILDNNRQTGLDHLDVGSRANYGLEASVFGFGAGPSSLFIGQSYNFHNPRDDLLNTGVHQGASDYVVRGQIFPFESLRLRYRSRLERKRLNTQRTEFSAEVGPPLLKAKVDYISITKLKNPLSDEQGGEQIFLGLSSQFTKYWTLSGGTNRELGKGGGALSQYVGLKYQDECLIFNTTLTKAFYRDRDIRPGITLWFTIEFKNLGAISNSVSTGGTSTETKDQKEDRP